MVQLRGAAVLGMSVALFGCGSGSETQTVTQNAETTTVTETSSQQVADRVVIQPVVGDPLEEPTEMPLSVSDLGAKDLVWTDWGSEVTTARGLFMIRQPPNPTGEVVEGGMVASDVKLCDGTGYYTKLNVTLEGDAPFQPGTIELSSPCSNLNGSTATTKPNRQKPPAASQSASDGGPRKINGITDGPVIGVDLTADAYHEDMQAWGSLSYDTKVGLARLFLQNNPNDCYALSEVVGSGAPVALARRVELMMLSGITGGMLISEVMLRGCQAGAE